MRQGTCFRLRFPLEDMAPELADTPGIRENKRCLAKKLIRNAYICTTTKPRTVEAISKECRKEEVDYAMSMSMKILTGRFHILIKHYNKQFGTENFTCVCKPSTHGKNNPKMQLSKQKPHCFKAQSCIQIMLKSKDHRKDT